MADPPSAQDPGNTWGEAPTTAPVVVPPRDWGKASWGDVLKHGAGRLIPSFGEDIWGGIKGIGGDLYHGGRQIVGAEPTTPGMDRLVVGAIRAALQQRQRPGEAPSLSDIPAAGHDILQTGRNLGHYYASKYGSIPALKRTAATDPAAPIMDASAVATIPVGGEGLLARTGLDAVLAGTRTGDVVNAIGAGARALRPVADPLGTGVQALRGGAVVDRAGNVTQAVRDALERAAPGSSAELDKNPAFRQRVIDTMGPKGISDRTAREAIIGYHAPDVPTPRGPTMPNRAPPPAAADTTANLTSNAHLSGGRRVSAIANAPPPSAAPGYPSGWAASDTADRQAALATGADGRFVDPTHQVRTNINGLESSGVFTGTEASNGRIGTYGQDLLDATLPQPTKSGVWPLIRGMAGTGAGLLGGTALAGATHGTSLIGPAIQTGMSMAGLGAERLGVEPALNVANKVRAGWGAPSLSIGSPRWAVGAMNVPQTAANLAGAGRFTRPGLWVEPPQQQDARTAAANPPPPPPSGATAVEPPPAWKPTDLSAPPPSPAAEPAINATDTQAGNVWGETVKDDAGTPKAWKAPKQEKPEDTAPAPQADGGRVGFAVGGQVADLTESLLKRAEQAQKAAQASTRPLLGLSDDTVAQALRVAQRGL
jgi:hypothetical protein